MKKSIKSILCMCFALLLPFSAAACNADEGKPDGPPDPPPAQSHVEQENYEFLPVISESQTLSLAAEAEQTVQIGKALNGMRYLRFKVETDINVLGTLTYSQDENGEPLTENFYIAAGETEFRQFLDAFRDKAVLDKGAPYTHEEKVKIGQAKNADWFVSVSFKNVSEKSGEFKLTALDGSTRSIDTQNHMLYMANETYKVGANLMYGGALTYLEKLPELGTALEYVALPDSSSSTGKRGFVGLAASYKTGAEVQNEHVNLINTWDAGRLIQQSYYGSNSGYTNIIFNGSSWCYNPVQGGDVMQNRGQIVDYRLYDDEIYVKTRAMDWARDGYTTPSYMENRYSLEGANVLVYNSFVDWSGVKGAMPREQEMPAIYLHYAFSNLQSYRGLEPWTNARLTNSPNVGWWSPPSPEGKFGNATENWVAWTNNESYGVGVYVPGITSFLNGKSGGTEYAPGTPGDLRDPADPGSHGHCSYTAPLITRTMEPYHKSDYTYALSVGYVDDLRANFYALKEADAIVNDNMK